MSASWIIRNVMTGEVICETFDKRDADRINDRTSNYEAVPVLQHLQELNRHGSLAHHWATREH